MKALKTNSKIVRDAIVAHILDSVNDYEDKPFINFENCATFVKSEFERVAGHANNVKRYPNKQERFSDYLNNGVFNFHIYFDDIKEFLNGLGINPEFKEYPDEKSLKLYHYLIFREIFK